MMDAVKRNDGGKVKVAATAMVLAVIIWGFSYVVTKLALNGEVPPLLVSAAGYTVGSVAGVPILIWKRKELRRQGVLLEGAVLGAILAVARDFQTVGCGLSTAGKNAFITAVYVVLTPVFMWILLKQKLTVKTMVTAMMALAGIGLVSLNESMTGINLGDVFTFLAAIGFAIHIVYNGRFAKRHDAVLLGILQVDFAALFSIMIYLISIPVTGQGIPAAFFTAPMIGCICYSGVLGICIGFVLQSYGQRYVEQNKAAMILAMESVSGAIFSVICLHEIFSFRMIIGCVIIFAAIMLSTYQKKS